MLHLEASSQVDMTSMNSLKVLHLSDLYVDVNDPTCKLFLGMLCEYIISVAGNDIYDLVFITGDIAYSGHADEYLLFENSFIKPLRKSKAFENSKIYATPGNHDLDCDIGLPLVWDTLGPERQANFFSDNENGRKIRKSRSQAFENYQNFLEKNEIIGVKPLDSVAAEFFADPPTREIWIGTVNTSLFSDKDVADHRKAISPLISVESLIKDSSHGLKILLGHHPAEWFTNDSAKSFVDYLEAESILYLHGHSGGVKIGRIAGTIGTIGVGTKRNHTKSDENHQLSCVANYFGIYTIGANSQAKFFEIDRHRLIGSEWAYNDEYLSTKYVEKQAQDEILEFTQKDSAGDLRENLAESVKQRVDFSGCVWSAKEENKCWLKLLQDLDKLEGGDHATFSVARSVPAGHQYFRVKNGRGSYLVYTVRSHGDVLTLEQLQSINTEFERNEYYGAIVVTLGLLDDSAKGLAVQLSARKNFSVLNYSDICTKILKRFASDALKYLSAAKNFNCQLKLIISDDGYHAFVGEKPPGNKYLIVNEAGLVSPETSKLVQDLKSINYIPQNAVYRENIVESEAQLLHKTLNEFDLKKYKSDNFIYFNDVKYAPLAALGFRFENAPLQDIYINTSASVTEIESHTYGLGRAISEMVDSFDLSKNQKDQLESQLRSKSGLEGPAETGMARQFYQRYNNILVLGDPGSGKTCFVKHELLSYCDPDGDTWYSKHLPVFVSLAEAANLLLPEIGILNICEQVSKRRGIVLTEYELERNLREGSVAFFFDGLDEVGSIEKRILLVEMIGRLVKRYVSYGNRFVVTSRPAAVQPVEIPELLTCLNLNGLSRSEMERLALSVLTLRLSDDGKAREVSMQDRQVVTRLIEDTNSSRGIARLATNPLLLTLLVLIYANAGAALSARRHLVYTQAIKTLVSVRGKDTRAQRISEADLRGRLGAIAISVFSKAINEIPSRKEVQEVLSEQIRLTEIYGASPTDASINAFIQEVAEATGLLSIHKQQGNEAQDLITFMHYSFLEYYAAAGLLSQDYLKKIATLADNPRWKDVITLLFGVLSEQGDVTNAFRILTEPVGEDSSEEVTNRRLLLAIECVSECEVAPEQTQILLANRLNSTLTSGAALYSAGLREELAEKLNGFLPNSGNAITKLFVNGLSSDSHLVVAATCDLLSKIDTEISFSDEVAQAFERSIYINNSTYRASAVQLLENRSEMRNTITMQVLDKALRGSLVEKHAALKTVGASPQYFYEKIKYSLISLLDDSNKLIARTAAQCLLATDVVLDGTEFPAIRAKVLNSLGSSEYDTGSVVMGVYAKRAAVQKFLNSSDARDVELGIRYMSLLQDEDAYISETVLELLDSRADDDRIVCAGLDALRNCDGALSHLKVTHNDKFLQLRQSGKRNIRISAIRLLGELPLDEEIANGLVAHMDQASALPNRRDEVNEAAQALSNLAKKNPSLKKSIISRMREAIPNPMRGFGSDKQQRYIAGMLSVCEDMGEVFPDSDSRRLLSLAEDHRTPDQLKVAFMRTYGRVAEPGFVTIESCIRLINGKNYKLHPSIYSATKSLISQCKRKVEYARVVYPALGKLRNSLISAWRREVSNTKDSIESSTLRDIRLALKEVDYLQSSYAEFAQRRDANGVQV